MRFQLGPTTLGAGAACCVAARTTECPEPAVVGELERAGVGALLLPAAQAARTGVRLALVAGVRATGDLGVAAAAAPHGLWLESRAVHDPALLEAAAETGLPLLLSCGGSTFEETRAAVSRLHGRGARRLVLLQRTECATGAPTSPDALEVCAVADLRARLGVLTGLDDTGPTVDAVAAAAALGATLVVKDFASSGAEPRPGAVRPGALAAAVQAVRAAEDVRGRGVKRVLACEQPWREAQGLGPAPPAASLRLRPAEERDLGLVWLWANDATARLASLVPGRIPYTRHVAWFRGALERTDVELWIAESDDGEPRGVVRLDRSKDSPSEVSLNVAPDARGAGVGQRALAALVEVLAARGPLPPLGAAIDDGNAASRRCFEAAGFRREGEREVRGARVGWFVHRGA